VIAPHGEEESIPRFVIEREIPGAGRLSANEVSQVRAVIDPTTSE
jgi:hypothetical protein